MQEGKVPKCEEVESDLISPGTGNRVFGHGGGNRKKVLVATALEMVQIMWALPGETAFKKNCADVVVCYLGGGFCVGYDGRASLAEVPATVGRGMRATPFANARSCGDNVNRPT